MVVGVFLVAAVAGGVAMGWGGVACAGMGFGLGAASVWLTIQWRLGSPGRAGQTTDVTVGQPAPPAVDRREAPEKTASALRHDLRGILSPIVLVADRLQGNADPAIQRAAQVLLQSVDRAIARLDESKMREPGREL